MALACNVQKHVLRQILSFRAVAENFSGNPMNQTMMTPKKDCKRFPVLCSDTEKKVLVGDRCWVQRSIPGRRDDVRSILGERQQPTRSCRKGTHVASRSQT